MKAGMKRRVKRRKRISQVKRRAEGQGQQGRGQLWVREKKKKVRPEVEIEIEMIEVMEMVGEVDGYSK